MTGCRTGSRQYSPRVGIKPAAMRLRIRERGYSPVVATVDFGWIVGAAEDDCALAERPSGEDDVARARPVPPTAVGIVR